MNVLKKDQLQIMLQIAVTVILFRFVLFEPLLNNLGLSKLHYFFYFIAIGVIIYASFILPDKVLVKNIEKGYYQYLGITMLGLAISFFVSSAIDKTYYFGFFLGLFAILYLYMTQWRKILIFDNVVYALIICSAIFMLVILDLMPSLQVNEQIIDVKRQQILNISLQICTLLWLLYFIKTIVFDLKFMELDLKHKRKTLATLHGRFKGAKRTTILSLIPLALIILFCLVHTNLNILIGYIVVFVVLPYLFYLYKLWTAESTENFNTISNILNVIIWLTIFSIVVLFFNLK
jgi:hypothetical protein